MIFKYTEMSKKGVTIACEIANGLCLTKLW